MYHYVLSKSIIGITLQRVISPKLLLLLLLLLLMMMTMMMMIDAGLLDSDYREEAAPKDFFADFSETARNFDTKFYTFSPHSNIRSLVKGNLIDC